MQPRSLIALLSMLALGAQAEPVDKGVGAGLLDAYLQKMSALRSEFRQTLLDEQERVVEEATGTVYLARPGRFRWEYREPEERVLVADGETLWMYDADLLQVTVRRLTDGLGDTPAALLTGEGAVLDNFEIVRVTESNTLTWVHLRPLSAESDFQSVALGFSGGLLNGLQLLDRLGQTTRIELMDAALNPDLPESTFRFEIPDGVDVIDDASL